MLIDPFSSGPTRALVEAILKPRRALLGRIHPHDEMYLYNMDLLHGNADCASALYFIKGHQVAAAVREIGGWFFKDYPRINSFLDFGSGYGRATRFLIQDLSPESVWVSDILPEAVEFQTRYFKVQGFPSTENPGDLQVSRKFQLIFAASLFSHLPRSVFGPWLKRLFDLVEDDGLLALSVLDMSRVSTGAQGQAEDFVFLPESESRVLDRHQYGTTYVTESFVQSTIRSEVHSLFSVKRIPAGLCAQQDLYVIAKRSGVEFSGFKARCFPEGELDFLEHGGGRIVKIGGWARDIDAGGAISEVRVFVNARIYKTLGVARARHGRTEIERWAAEIDLGEVGLDDVILVMAKSSKGLANVVAIGTLRPFIST